MTGSGKTAAFLLPILHQLIDRPRGVTRALVLTPTRELAAQILEDLNDLAVHTPITGAAVFGGVGMGPQEHAFRSGVDVHGRHPRAAARPLPDAVRQAGRDRVPGAGRGGPDAGHGLPPRHPAGAPAPAAEAADAVLQRHHAGPDRDADPRDAPQPGDDPARPEAGAGGGDHPGGLPGAPGAQVRAARRPAPAGRDAGGAGLHPHQAPGQPAGRLPGAAWHQGRADPRQPLPGAADRGAGRVQEREVPGAGGHRHRRPRHRRRGAGPRGELRRAEGGRGLHPPGGPHRAGRADRRRLHPRVARGGGRASRHRAGGGKAPAAGHRSGLRLHGQAGSPVRGAAGGANRRDPGQEGGGPGPVEGQGGAPDGAPGSRPPERSPSARPGQRGGRGRPRNGGSPR